MAKGFSKYEHWAQKLLKDTFHYNEDEIRNAVIRWENTPEALTNFLRMFSFISEARGRYKLSDYIPIIVMRYCYNISYRAIGDEFKISGEGALQRIRRGLRMFRGGFNITLKGTSGNEQRYNLLDFLAFGQARTQRILEMYSKQIVDLSKLDIKQLNEELKAYVKNNNTKETAKLREYMKSNDKFKVKQTNFDTLINNFGVNTVGEIKEAIYNIQSDVARVSVRKRKALSTSVPIIEAFEILDLLIYKKYNKHIIKRIRTQSGLDILNWSI